MHVAPARKRGQGWRDGEGREGKGRTREECGAGARSAVSSA